MATVTGLTADRMLAIEGASVVSGSIVVDDLVLTKHDGSTVNAGNVRGPVGPTGPFDLPSMRSAITGNTINAGNISGTINISTYVDTSTIVNASIVGVLVGDVAFDASNFPSNASGPAFRFLLIQDATGGRKATFTGFHLIGLDDYLSTQPNNVTIVEFYNIATGWVAKLQRASVPTWTLLSLVAPFTSWYRNASYRVSKQLIEFSGSIHGTFTTAGTNYGVLTGFPVSLIPVGYTADFRLPCSFDTGPGTLFIDSTTGAISVKPSVGSATICSLEGVGWSR